MIYKFQLHPLLNRWPLVGIAAIVTFFLQVALLTGQGLPKSGGGSPKEFMAHYDVVSVRAASPDERGLSIGGTADTFTARNVTIALLIENAYNLREDSIVGIPESLSSKRFDVVAKIVDASPQKLDDLSGEQRRRMLESLLRDRFLLSSHSTTKTQQVYVLTQVKHGTKIKPTVSPDKEVGGIPAGAITASNGHIKAHAIPIASLIGSLAGAVQSEVIDETKLGGVYDFDLSWDPTVSGTEGGPSLFTALRDELGLQLVPAKRQVPILIVDHVQMPTPN